MKTKNTILYIGGFLLPDGNAAAQRVIANAKLFSDTGFNVAFLSFSKDLLKPRTTEYFGFQCFEFPSTKWSAIAGEDIVRIEEVLNSCSDISCIAAYNYRSVSLARLLRLCRKRGIKCIGDVTEWYRARDVSLVKRPFKLIDTGVRMRLLNPRMDGLIVISSFLQEYYSSRLPIVLLPPLVDSSEQKWFSSAASKADVTTLVYAGKPSRTKERLDLIVEAVVSLPRNINVRLDIVGVTDKEFSDIYDLDVGSNPRVVFHGRLSHSDALEIVKAADYSIIIRDDNLVTRAGFPTKFAESVTCGTPVICNKNSDLCLWINKYGCGHMVEEGRLSEGLMGVIAMKRPIFDRGIFDYRNYRSQTERFFQDVYKEEGFDAAL